MSDGTLPSPDLELIRRELRSIVDRSADPYDAGIRVWSTAFQRAERHEEFSALGFNCPFNTFVVALKRAKAKNKSETTSLVIKKTTAPSSANTLPQTTQGGSRANKDPEKDGGPAKSPKGEIPGFVSSEKTDPTKLREQLV